MRNPPPAFQRTTLADHRQQSPSPFDPTLASTSLGRIPVSISTLRTQGAQDREAEQAALQANQVHQDNLWRELLEAELRSNKRWIENWSFLKDYNPMGNKKEHPKLPEYISLFSDIVPNTANQVIGSRVNTELELWKKGKRNPQGSLGYKEERKEEMEVDQEQLLSTKKKEKKKREIF